MKTSAWFILALASFCLGGCYTIDPPKYHKSVRLESMKAAYLVRDPESTQGCANAAEEALTARRVKVTSGFLQQKPKDVDFYVEVVDRWRWDVAMYLSALEIRFRDNMSGELIATGTYRQNGTFFHSFPDAKKITFEVIDYIYNGQPTAK